MSTDALEAELSKRPSRPCGAFDMAATGWAEPLGRHGEQRVHSANGYLLICAKTEQKLLPASLVREIVSDKVADIEEQQMRKVRKKEKDEIKESVLNELLPKAFVKSQRLYAYIDARGEYLVVDSANAGKAEDFVSLLRETLGSLEVVPLDGEQSVSFVLTQWLSTLSYPPEIVPEHRAELRQPDLEGGIIRVRNEDLGSDEIRAHLENGKMVTQLGLIWNERLKFTWSEDFGIKGLKFLELVQDQMDDMEVGSEAEQMDAIFSMMTLELNQLIPSLLRYVQTPDQNKSVSNA